MAVSPWLAALAGGLSGYNDFQQEAFQKKRLLEQDAQRRDQLRQQQEDRELMRQVQAFQAQTARGTALDQADQRQFERGQTLFGETPHSQILGDDLLGQLGPFKGLLKTGQLAAPKSATPLALPGKAFSLEAPSGGEPGFVSEIADADPLKALGKGPTLAGLNPFGTYRPPSMDEQKGLNEEAIKTQDRENQTLGFEELRKQFSNDPGMLAKLRIYELSGAKDPGAFLREAFANPEAESTGSSDFARYFNKTALPAEQDRLGRPLTLPERKAFELAERKQFNQADDQPRSSGVPVIIQGSVGGEPGFYQVSRGADPQVTRVGVDLPPTAAQKEFAEQAKGLVPFIKGMEDISKGIITKVGPQQRANAIARGTAAVFGNDPDFKLYQNFRNGLAVQLSVLAQGARPSDADVFRAALPMIPDPYTSTAPEAEKAWQLIYSQFRERLSPEMRARLGIPDAANQPRILSLQDLN